jgi:branched-chain amino acid transport system substrate-binding protein
LAAQLENFMKILKHRHPLTAIVTSLLLGSLAPQAQAQAQGTIKLGMTSALTGPFNEFGEGSRRGAILAIEMFNKNGGLNGRKAELAEVLDDQLVPDRAVQNMRRILDNKDIVGIIAPAGSGPALATMDMLEADGRPVCNALAQSPQVTLKDGEGKPPRANIFSVAVTNKAEAAALSQVLGTKYKSVGILHESTAYGVTGTQMVKADLLAKNPNIKVEVEAYNQRSQDMASQVARMQRSNVEALLVIGLGADFAVIRKNISRANLKFDIYGSAGAMTPPYIEGAGDLTVGTRTMSPVAFAARPLQPTAQTFVDQYRAAHGIDRWYGSDEANPQLTLGTIVGHGYDCARILLESIKVAGTTERGAVIAAINKINNFKGVTISSLSFSPSNHDAFGAKDLGLFEMRKGKDGKVFLSPIKD